MRADPGKIEVAIRVFGGLGKLPGPGRIVLTLPAGSDIEQALTALGRGYPELSSRLREGIARGYVNVLLNGRNVRFQGGLKTTINDGDSLAFLPPVGGG